MKNAVRITAIVGIIGYGLVMNLSHVQAKAKVAPPPSFVGGWLDENLGGAWFCGTCKMKDWWEGGDWPGGGGGGGNNNYDGDGGNGRSYGTCVRDITTGRVYSCGCNIYITPKTKIGDILPGKCKLVWYQERNAGPGCKNIDDSCTATVE